MEKALMKTCSVNSLRTAQPAFRYWIPCRTNKYPRCCMIITSASLLCLSQTIKNFRHPAQSNCLNIWHPVCRFSLQRTHVIQMSSVVENTHFGQTGDARRDSQQALEELGVQRSKLGQLGDDAYLAVSGWSWEASAGKLAFALQSGLDEQAGDSPSRAILQSQARNR